MTKILLTGGSGFIAGMWLAYARVRFYPISLVQIDELKAANNRLSRRKRVTKKRLQTGGTLILESCKFLASQTPFKTKRKHDEEENPGLRKRIETCCRRCGNCGEIGHNSRTCENEVESIPSDTSN